MGATGTITLTTDFGTQDGYVGAMKGVILSEHPAARLIDITHEVPPQDVVAGAFALAQAAALFPSGTVHLAVVDPGVGSARRAIIVERGGALYVGPDNGLFFMPGPDSDEKPSAHAAAHAIDRVPSDWRLHPTFHGRDLFARVAARLAGGAAIGDFSSTRVDPVRLDLPQPVPSPTGLMGEIVHVDRFGNLVTNLKGRLPVGQVVEICGVEAEAAVTYSDVEKGRLLAYVGSSGHIEIAVRDGSAAQLLGAGRGAHFRMRPQNGTRKAS